ncbi:MULTISPECIES: hypothetical protein [Protofrankia]|uniref:hypothetical protein n=1 Tax=Protofrankia TaxID=2994361 RepID=UPI0001C538D1|nr:MULTISPECIES: hypothetical protein [Protofrankia]
MDAGNHGDGRGRQGTEAWSDADGFDVTVDAAHDVTDADATGGAGAAGGAGATEGAGVTGGIGNGTASGGDPVEVLRDAVGRSAGGILVVLRDRSVLPTAYHRTWGPPAGSRSSAAAAGRFACVYPRRGWNGMVGPPRWLGPLSPPGMLRALATWLEQGGPAGRRPIPPALRPYLLPGRAAIVIMPPVMLN